MLRCANCALVFDGVSGEACPRCGLPLASPWETPSTASDEDGDMRGGVGIPWESHQSVTSLLETIKLVALHPEQTFSSADPHRTLGASFGFAMVVGVIGSLLGLITGHFVGASLPSVVGRLIPSLEPYVEQMAGSNELTDLIAPVIATPILFPIVLFSYAGLVHLALVIMGGQRGTFDATFRAQAYSYALSPLGAVPIVGSLVVTIWSTIIIAFAIRSLHQVSMGKALLAAFSPLLLALFCCGCALLAMSTLLLSASGS